MARDLQANFKGRGPTKSLKNALTAEPLDAPTPRGGLADRDSRVCEYEDKLRRSSAHWHLYVQAKA